MFQKVFAIALLVFLLNQQHFETKETGNILSSKEALKYLKSSRRRRDISSLDNECCVETCGAEERAEHKLIGSYVDDKLRYNCKYFYCETLNNKYIKSSWKCDGDNDCGNNEDEKYCKLTQKYRDKRYTENELIKGTELRGGTTKYEGNVYLLNRPVCDDNWSSKDAKVVCRSLGCSEDTVPIAYQNSYFGKPAFADFILDNVKCYGYERHLGVCEYYTVANCKAGEVAGVRCIDPKKLELIGGHSMYFGNVHISGKPICDDNWTSKAAAVVCKGLGRSSEVVPIAMRHSTWGTTDGDYALDDVRCSGNENILTECLYSTKDNCGTGEAASVVCFEPDTIKLDRGDEGTVMAMDRVATVTNLGHKWQMNESQVLCNQLFGQVFSPKKVPVFSYTQKKVNLKSNECVIQNVNCNGNEAGIHKCKYDVIGRCPFAATNTIEVSCGKCEEGYFINLIQSLTLDGTRDEQYQSVIDALAKLDSNCKHWDCSGQEKHFTYPSFCYLKSSLEEWKSILEPTSEGNVVFLENKFDYGKLLQQNFLSQKFSDIQNDILKLGDQMTTFQKDLANHFRVVAQFDTIKIGVDLHSLTEAWGTSINALDSQKNLLQKQLAEISDHASDILLADKVELVVDVILQIVQAVLSGPKELAGGIVSIHETAKAIAKSAADSARLNFVIKQLPKIQTIITNMDQKMNQNKDAHQAMEAFFSEIKKGDFTLVTAKTFLKHYKEFEGAIDPVEVAKLSEQLSFMVDEMCSMISNAGSVTGNIIAAVKANEGICLEAKLTITSLVTTYDEMEEDQKKIKKGYASLARAYISKTSADRLSEILQTSLNDKFSRAMTQFRSAFHLKEQKRRLIKEACDQITYLNYGVEEAFCTQIRSHVDMDISKLVSYKYDRDMCRDKTREMFVTIPIQVGKETALDRLNLRQLLQKGNNSYWKTNGDSLFQIPDETWLLTHGWIQHGDIGPFYVKKFEVFAPTIQPNGTYFSVESQVKLVKNVVGNTTYIFGDPMHLKCNYYENYKYLQTCTDKIIPYSNCDRSHLRHVCVTRSGELSGPFYPPINSLWKIDIRSKYQIPFVHSSTTFYIRARIQLCFKGSSTRMKRHASYGNHCCLKDQYYDMKERIAASGGNPCKYCPIGSQPRMEGYFCEECPMGHQPSPQIYGCMPCPMGTYKNATGSMQCQKCSVGKNTPSTGSAICQ